MTEENENELESFENFCGGEGLGLSETERFRDFIREKQDGSLIKNKTSNEWQELLDEFDLEDIDEYD